MAAHPILKPAKSVGQQRDFIGPATFADTIVSRVRDALFDGKLTSGDFLGSEKDLAAEYGVSRNTARDALRTLEAMGIVDIRVGAGGGARIAEGNPDKFAEALAIQFNLAGVSELEILDAQWAIEGMAAELAAHNATDEDLAAMSSLLEGAERAIDDPSEFSRLGMQFHMTIAEASHNRALVAQLIAMRHVVWPKGGRIVSSDRAQIILRVHRDLFKLICERDGAGARDLMHAHLDAIRMNNKREREQRHCCC